MSDEMGPGPKKNWKPLRFYAALGTERWPLVSGGNPHSYSAKSFYAVIGDPDQPEAVPFDGHLRPVKIEIEESNYWKSSELSGDEVRKSCSLVVYVQEIEVKDGGWVKVLERGFRETTQAMHWWLAHSHELDEHPVDWWRGSERTAVEGRLVEWEGQPAKIQTYFNDGTVVMVPDGIERFRGDGSWVKDDIFSTRIFWWRP